MEMKYFRGATNHKKRIFFLVVNRNISKDKRGMEEKKGLHKRNADLHSFELP